MFVTTIRERDWERDIMSYKFRLSISVGNKCTRVLLLPFKNNNLRKTHGSNIQMKKHFTTKRKSYGQKLHTSDKTENIGKQMISSLFCHCSQNLNIGMLAIPIIVVFTRRN